MGSEHSQRALVRIPLLDADRAPCDQGMVLVPMTDLTVEDTWYVAGMKRAASTGSSPTIGATERVRGRP